MCVIHVAVVVFLSLNTSFIDIFIKERKKTKKEKKSNARKVEMEKKHKKKLRVQQVLKGYCEKPSSIKAFVKNL